MLVLTTSDETLALRCRTASASPSYLTTAPAQLPRPERATDARPGSTLYRCLVVEKLSGQSLGSYLRQHVWGPLRMTDSTFEPSAEQRGRLLRVMQRQADGKLAPSALDLPPTSEWDAAGHGSYGTVQDYGRFVQAWLNDGAGVLAAATAQMALQGKLGQIELAELVQ